MSDPMQNIVSRQFDLAQCLDFDAFQGDFGAMDHHVFENKIVAARKEHECFGCGQQIKKGEKHRLLKEKSDGDMNTFRWCGNCCIAMILDMAGHSLY